MFGTPQRTRTSTIFRSLESKPSVSTIPPQAHYVWSSLRTHVPTRTLQPIYEGEQTPDAFGISSRTRTYTRAHETDYPQTHTGFTLIELLSSVSPTFTILIKLAIPVRIELTPLSSKPNPLPLSVRDNNILKNMP